MVAEAAKHNVPVLLDTSGASLDAALEAEVKPTLVKPNLTEINALLGTSYTCLLYTSSTAATASSPIS